MKDTIVFIGCGSMASAMIRGMVESGQVLGEQIIASAPRGGHFEEIAALGAETTHDNCAAARRADVLFLAVKPYLLEEVAREIKDHVPEGCLIVSVAAGKTLETLSELFGADAHVVRVMPNTPAAVRESMSAVSASSSVTEEEKEKVLSLLRSFGRAEEIPEKLMDVFGALAGSSPAWVYMFIEALADGAVAEGMPRAQAYTFGAQAVKGAAEMVLSSGKHPGQLKDEVCSPGGTTIEAVAVLEEMGMRSAVIEAERACVEKTKALR